MLSTNSNRPEEPNDRLLSAIPQLKSLRFNRPQSDHLQWLVDRCGVPFVWNDPSNVEPLAKLIIVLRPPTGPQVEAFCRSLPMDSVVVIPFGENPVFDFLKSKLVSFGAVAPSGPDGPHTLWWGGPRQNDFATNVSGKLPLIVSCFDPSSNTAAADRLIESLQALDLEHSVEPASGPTSAQRARFILNKLETASRSVLYVDPTAIFKQLPMLLTHADCDIAIHKWLGWALSTHTLFFGCSVEAKAVLRTWLQLISSCPTVPEAFLLDQAWSLVSSQVPLRTLWLPRSYHSLADDGAAYDIPTIEYDLDADTSEFKPLHDFPAALRAARRAGRTGSPEAQLVLSSPAGNRDTVVVVVRDVQVIGAVDVASTMRSVADAFSRNPGRFGQLELSLCRWDEDFTSAISAAEKAGACIVVIEPTSYVWSRMFADLGPRLSADPQKRRFRAPPKSVREIVHLH